MKNHSLKFLLPFAVVGLTTNCPGDKAIAQQPWDQQQLQQQQQQQQQLQQQQLQQQSWAQQQYQNNLMQRNAMLQQQQRGTSSNSTQLQRWQNEWMQQHPGQPVPNMGALEHLHESEIINNTKQGFAMMRQKRQEELVRNRIWARENQRKALAAQNITWSDAQWKNWEIQYDQQMRQNADDYLHNVGELGAIVREEERRKNLGY